MQEKSRNSVFTLKQLLVSLYQNCHAHDLWRNLQKRLSLTHSPFHREKAHTHILFIILIHFIGDILHSSFIVCTINFTTPITFSFYQLPLGFLANKHCVKAVIIHWQYCRLNGNEKRKRKKESDKKEWWWVCVSLTHRKWQQTLFSAV